MTTHQEELLPATRRALLHRIAVAQAEGGARRRSSRRWLGGGHTVWHGARTLGRRAWPGRERAVPDRLDHQDVHRRSRPATAGRGAARSRGPAGEASAGYGGGGGHDRRAAGALGWAGRRVPRAVVGADAGLVLRPELADVLGKQPLLHPVGRRHHYSNPGYTLLGALVEKLRGAPWEDVLRREVLEPLGLDRTTGRPRAPHAGGWAVHPWADVMLAEPAEDLGRMAPAGQLWSTTGDLARFAVFLARGDDRVLSAETVREMRAPAARPRPLTSWTARRTALGLQIQRWDGRLLVGGTPAPCRASWPTSPSASRTTWPRWY